MGHYRNSIGSLTKKQGQEVDALILADRMLDALRFYRQITKTSLIETTDEIYSRQKLLREKHPLPMQTVEALIAESIQNLGDIQEEIVVLEGSWDGDDRGWVIWIAAITEHPSHNHSRYTAHDLCGVRGVQAQEQIDEAVTIGTSLANYASVEFYLTDYTPDYSKIDDTKRWWDPIDI